MSGVQFSADGKPVIFNSGTGNVTPFQQLNPNSPGKFDRSLQVNAHGGTQRTYVGGDATSFAAVEDGIQRFRAEDIKGPDHGSIVGSSRTTSGREMAASELRDDSLVEITLSDGTRTKTTVASALRLGAIKKVGDTYEDVRQPPAPQAQPQVQQQTIQADPLSTDVPVDEEFSGHTAAVKLGLSHLFITNSINEAVTQGAFSPATVNAAAKQWGTTPETALGVLQGAQAGMGAAYERYVSGAGIRPADFTAFMQKQPETMALLMSQQASIGRTSVWAPMIRQYRATKR
jgi:hypothetical protein